MNEPKDLVARLRAVCFDEYSGDEDLKNEAAREIERLTRERDEARRWNVNQVAHELVETGLRAEIEQLKEMNAHLSRGNIALSAVEHKLTAEVERLRAALERIAGHDLDDIQQMEIAREALRPPDETAAVKPPKCKHPKVLIDDVLAKTCPDCGELV